MSKITTLVTKAVNSITLPEYVESARVSRLGGQRPGCMVDFKIANHVFTMIVQRSAKADSISDDIMSLLTDSTNDNLAVAIGKTVIPQDQSYGWSSVDTLRAAGFAVLCH